MKSDIMLDVEKADDARWVELALKGDRDAFGNLVTRYQSSVCGVAFSACGNLSQSQDLAQEAFIVAWRKLGDLKEAGKFRSWLFGITRNLVNSSFRRQTRNPLTAAEQLDEGMTTTTLDTNPTEQAMSNDEEIILWRSLESIPESYREPLILFYREDQSIEKVAEVMELSEEAVRQRLSRGRKLLQEQFMGFVEGALKRTAPTQVFTAMVLASLPLMTISAKAATVGAAAKGGAMAKGAVAGGFFVILKSLLFKFAPLLAGMWMGSQLSESQRERKFTRKAVGVLVMGAIACPVIMQLGIYFGRKYWDADQRALTIWTIVSCFVFVGLVMAYAIWMGRTQSRIRKEEAKASVVPGFVSQTDPYEYRSAQTLLGLPLVHICFNCVKDGKKLPAKGWIAIGERAYGVLFAGGAVAVGAISCGANAIGLLAIGGFGLGVFAFGGLGIGIVAMGGGAIGYIAFGGGAMGWLAASGGATVARHFAIGGGAIAEHANDKDAEEFMLSSYFFRNAWTIFYVLILVPALVMPGLNFYYKWRRERKFRTVKTA